MSYRHSHRRHRNDSDDDDETVHSKRSRGDHGESVAREKLEGLIASIGNSFTVDQHESLQNQLHGLASVLEGEIGRFRKPIIDALVDNVFDRPDKLCIYATLIGLLNLKNDAFVGELLERLVRALREQLHSGADWDAALYCTRFLSDLANCGVVSPTSVLQLYSGFVEVTLEEHIPQARSDFFVHCVLASLPWSAGLLAEKHRPELYSLLDSIDTYRSRRSLLHVPALQSLVNTEQLDSLDSLWHQVKSMEKSEWKEKCVVRFEAFQSMFRAPEVTQHNLPSIAPLPHEEATRYPLPTVVFRLFDYTDVPEDRPSLPGELSVERYLVEQQLLAVIGCTYGERKDCAVSLLNCRFGVKVPLSYIIAELLIGRILRLPQPEHPTLFYSSLLLELCKEDSETMPTIVWQATLNLFDKLDTMNTLCVDRFVRWFAYHLSQCQYKWSWTDWAEALQLPPLHPKYIFLREMVQFLIRFSYYEHVKKIMTGSAGSPLYSQVLPEQPPECVYKYKAVSSEQQDEQQQQQQQQQPPEAVSEVARRLTEKIRSRCTPEEAIEVLKELPDEVSGGDDGDESQKSNFNELQVDVFFTTLFHLASKSFSHSFAALAKFDILCKALVPAACAPAKQRLLDTMHECWRWHEQMMVVLVDKMVKVQLLDCQSVMHWLLTRLDAGQLGRFYVWDIVESTLAKMCKHSARLADDHARVQRRYDAYHEHMKDGQQELEEVPDDTPTREELEKRQRRAEAAEAELRTLLETLLTRCFGLLQQTPDEDPNSEHFRKLLLERCLGTCMLHCHSVLPHLRQLRGSVSFAGGAAQAGLQAFFERFFALTD